MRELSPDISCYLMELMLHIFTFTFQRNKSNEGILKFELFFLFLVVIWRWLDYVLWNLKMSFHFVSGLQTTWRIHTDSSATGQHCWGFLVHDFTVWNWHNCDVEQLERRTRGRLCFVYLHSKVSVQLRRYPLWYSNVGTQKT